MRAHAPRLCPGAAATAQRRLRQTHAPARLARWVLLLALMAASWAVARAAEREEHAALALAQQELEAGHWPEAFAAFAQLADGGHASAARQALLMWRHGPTLYGQRFPASAQQRSRWSWLAACDALPQASACAAQQASQRP